MFYGGLKYGFWWGSLINMVGLLMTTLFGYMVGLLGKMEKVMEHPTMNKFKEQVDKRGIAAVGFLRVIPILPYNVTSIGSGMLKVDFKKYFMVNLACLPYAIIWAFLGDVFGETLRSRIKLELNWNLLLPTIIVVVVLFFLIRYLKIRFGQELLIEDNISEAKLMD